MRPDEQLEQQLSAAGDRARSQRSPGPDAAFATALRDRLLAQYPAPAPVGEPRAPRRRFAWLGFPRQLRLAPLALAAVLAVATVAGARELYVALVAPPAPTATPSPSPSLAPTQQPTPAPTPSATPETTVAPTAAATAAPTAEPTLEPTPAPTPKPTAKPTPKPTPVPVQAMSLATTGCNGGVVLGWSPYSGSGFAFYATLRGTSSNVPAAYPPAEGVVKVGTSFAENPAVTSAYDLADAGITYWYRTVAVSGAGKVIGASPVVSSIAKPIKALGPLVVDAVAEGTSVTWSPYGGLSACFSYYKVVWSLEHPEPSYLAGDPAVPVEPQAASNLVLGPEQLVPGQAYFVRVQAIRVTGTGKFVVAQSDVATYEVPPS